MDTLLPRFGIEFDENQQLDFSSIFAAPGSPVWLEIGFGNGDALLDMATRYPETNFIGVEVHEPGVGQALMGIDSRELTNIRIIQHDAMEVLEHMIPSAALQRVLLFFPDPWRKKRHFKRRIVQNDFIELVANKLEIGGVLHCATDWQDYAEWMLEKLNACEVLNNNSDTGEYSPRPEWRTNTRFEQRGERLGHEVADLLYTRT
ncbi:UNVERIFIED_CONTAM: hypothetical protein GTU68_039484 [Idotea baltica]|nr:hypothetical protein [Idotea baltica]